LEFLEKTINKDQKGLLEIKNIKDKLIVKFPDLANFYLANSTI